MNEDVFWNLINKCVEETPLVANQIRSFESFVNSAIHKSLLNYPPIKLEQEIDDGVSSKEIEVSVRFVNSKIAPPETIEHDQQRLPLYPRTARLRHLDYFGRLHATIEKRVTELRTGRLIATSLERNVLLGGIPIMVQSSYCNTVHGANRMIEGGKISASDFGECVIDKGGYFIVNGNERVIVAQERLANGVILCFKSSDREVVEMRIGSATNLVVKSIVKVYFTPPVKTACIVGEVIRVSIPYLREHIPVAILLKALGLNNDQKIIDVCTESSEERNLLDPSLDEAFWLDDEEEALDFISRRLDRQPSENEAEGAEANKSDRDRRLDWTRRLLIHYFLPEVGCSLPYLASLYSEEEGVPDRNDSSARRRTLKGEDRKILQGKANYVGLLVNRLLKLRRGLISPDHRDEFRLKRVDSAGALLSVLFENGLNVLMKDATKKIRKELKKVTPSEILVAGCFSPELLTKVFRYSLATGNWATKANKAMSTSSTDAGKTGVSQILQRLTYLSAISHLRRLVTPLSNTGKLASPRMLHNSQWGRVCPFETPEGLSVGIVKNLALLTKITVGDCTSMAIDLLSSFSFIPLDKISSFRNKEEVLEGRCYETKIFMNSNWLGVTNSPKELVMLVRAGRRHLRHPEEVSISWDIEEAEIHIFTDGGRLSRPLLVVDRESQKLKLSAGFARMLNSREKTWKDLIVEGIVEYLDAAEEERALIAETSEKLGKDEGVIYSHCEIHPAMLLGVCASVIPFANHNQSPRNTYQSAMGKHAMGVYTSNYQERFDTVSHVLCSPQMPVAYTKSMGLLNYDELPAGINCIVAIASYCGLNQEDSIILNKSAVDRGLFRSFTYRSYNASATQVVTNENDLQEGEVIEKPDFEKLGGRRPGDFDVLDTDGLAMIGANIKDNSALIGKTVPAKAAEKYTPSRCDDSVFVKGKEEAMVDRVLLSCSLGGERFVSVKTRAYRIPVVGDKLSSRHGQKGTIGSILENEDMPFTSSGIIPDIIINPHCIPSRMTIGQILECVCGKLGVLRGNRWDSSPFLKLDLEEVRNALLQEGFEAHGNETLYSGFTGERISSQIFIGPTFYQRLRHMVVDKIHARARGPLNVLTRQPVEGRAREGGLRLGEMERDCMIAHGASAFLREKLFKNSDYYNIYVCSSCGLPAVYNSSKKLGECKTCGLEDSVHKVKVPYATKLLIQELMGMGISPKLELEN